MQSPLQITVRGMPASVALEQHIHEKFKKLERMFDHITHCQVIVDLPHKHQQQGRHFEITISLGVPGHDIVVRQAHDEDPYVALRDAFDASTRQLEDWISRCHDKQTRSGAAA